MFHRNRFKLKKIDPPFWLRQKVLNKHDARFVISDPKNIQPSIVSKGIVMDLKKSTHPNGFSILIMQKLMPDLLSAALKT